MRSALVVVILLFAAPINTQEKQSDFSLSFPTAGQLFRPETEAEARQRIVNVAKAQNRNVRFPPEIVLVGMPDPSAKAPQTILVPPSTVCYRPLYFEDRRTERDNLSCGSLEPIRSALLFYGNAALLPVKLIVQPPWTMECWTDE